MDFNGKLNKAKALLATRRGRNAMVFSCFLLLSAVLWVVQRLNEDMQTDLRCRIAFTNVPDSVTRISPLPDYVNVSVRGRGTSLLKYLFNRDPLMQIDYRAYARNGRVAMRDRELKSYFHDAIGAGGQILSVSPDSMVVVFTSKPGVCLPVDVVTHDQAGVMPGVVRQIKASPDSVLVYTPDGRVGRMTSVPTASIDLGDISSSHTVRVPLMPKANMRYIPDSVDVNIEVEPLVSRTVNVDIRPVNVPQGMRLITLPRQTEIYYMVPMSVYRNTPAEFKVVADYRHINPATGRIPVTLLSTPQRYTNVFLVTDSVEYLIEQ